MKIEGTGNFSRELRQLAGDVKVRYDLEESEIDRERLANLGEILLIAAEMAADIEDVQALNEDMSDRAAGERFEEILYREWPEGPSAVE